MRSRIERQKIPRSGPGQFLTLTPGDICLSQYLPHHDRMTPNSAPYFSVQCVEVMGI